MERGWYQDPADATFERFHDGAEWTQFHREKKAPSNNGASNALFWVAAIAGLAGMYVGMRPVYAGASSCGSAWFPGGCVPGILDSATTVSVVFMLIAGAAIITAIATRNRTP